MMEVMVGVVGVVVVVMMMMMMIKMMIMMMMLKITNSKERASRTLRSIIIPWVHSGQLAVPAAATIKKMAGKIKHINSIIIAHTNNHSSSSQRCITRGHALRLRTLHELLVEYVAHNGKETDHLVAGKTLSECLDFGGKKTGEMVENAGARMQTYHYDDESHKVTADNAAETLRVSDTTILAGNPIAFSFGHLCACEQHLLLHEVPRGALSAEPAALE
jgi:hypothetical protein